MVYGTHKIEECVGLKDRLEILEEKHFLLLTGI
jgi:hypothetical protein